METAEPQQAAGPAARAAEAGAAQTGAAVKQTHRSCPGSPAALQPRLFPETVLRSDTLPRSSARPASDAEGLGLLKDTPPGQHTLKGKQHQVGAHFRELQHEPDDERGGVPGLLSCFTVSLRALGLSPACPWGCFCAACRDLRCVSRLVGMLHSARAVLVQKLEGVLLDSAASGTVMYGEQQGQLLAPLSAGGAVQAEVRHHHSLPARWSYRRAGESSRFSG